MTDFFLNMSSVNKMLCSSDEEVVFYYLMKICGLDFKIIEQDKGSLMALMMIYKQRVFVDSGCHNESCDQETSLCMDYLKTRHSTDGANGKMKFEHDVPIACYRCKGRGHIARGCKSFFCHRCKEEGHVRSGCRKRLVRDPDSSGSASSGSRCDPSSPAEELCEISPLHVSTSKPSLNEVVIQDDHLDPDPDQVCETQPVSSEVGANHTQELISSISSAVEHVDEPWPDLFNEEEACTADVMDHDLEVADLFEDNDSDIVLEDRSENGVRRPDEVPEGFDVIYTDPGWSIFSWVKENSAEPVQSLPVSVEGNECLPPVWTYLSEELGCDCSQWTRSQFFSHVRANPYCLPAEELEDILETIKEDMAECERSSYAHWYV